MQLPCHRRPIAWEPQCARCPALAANRRQVVPGYGPSPSRIAWIGEAPGRRGADLTGVPFTGDRSGQRLQRLLMHLGLSTEKDPACAKPRLTTFVTNLVRCNPPANRAPTATEMASCRPFLTAELSRVRPEVLVTLGLLPTRAAFAEFLNRRAERIGALHARPVAVPDRLWPRLIVPSRHPARIARSDWALLGHVLTRLLCDPANGVRGGRGCSSA